MPDDEKNKYKDLALKYDNSNCTKEQPIKQITDLEKNSNDFLNMKKYIAEMFENIPNDEGKNY